MNDRGDDAQYRAPRASLSLADFELLKRIGDGSYSQVVLARHRASGKEYALKSLPPAYDASPPVNFLRRHKVVEHVKRERQLLDRLSYEGIVQLYFTFQDALSLYMGLEVCPNGELYDQIRMRGKLDEGSARFYAAEVVLMLEVLRRESVVHRDIKPENLLLTHDGHLKLIDFGSAKQLSPHEVTPPQAAAPREQAGTGQGQQQGGAGCGSRQGEKGGADCGEAKPRSGAPAGKGGRGRSSSDTAYSPDISLASGAACSRPDAGHDTQPAPEQGAQHPQQAAATTEERQQQPCSSSGGSSGGSDPGADEEEGVRVGAGLTPKRAVSLVGTADYVSPEVLRSERVSCACDLWALGCVLHQMLVGRAPFKSASEYLTFQKILEGSVSPPDQVSEEARDLILRLLVPEPSQRLGSQDLAELRAHPFFAGVDWDNLRSQPAPSFIAPDVESIGSDASSFDWELQSLSAALPNIPSSSWQYEDTAQSDTSD
ncbi:hypothetical protein N2152v2_008432 [Parachlorella kessleri]